MGLFRKKRSAPAEAPPNDAWIVAEGENEGQLMTVRFNDGLREVDRRAYPHRIGVAVPFLEPRDDGFPGEQDLEALNEIEDRLEAALNHASGALLAVAITTSGMREFVFYASDPHRAVSQLERVRAATDAYDVQSYVERDPNWVAYDGFRP